MAEKLIDVGKGQYLKFTSSQIFLSTPDKCVHVDLEGNFTLSDAIKLCELHGAPDLMSPVVVMATYNYVITTYDEWVELNELDGYYHLKQDYNLYTKNGTQIYFVNKVKYNQYKVTFKGDMHTFLSEHAIVRKVKR